MAQSAQQDELVVSARDLRRHLPELLTKASQGERIRITRNGVTTAVLVPPDATAAASEQLVARGWLNEDWQERQRAASAAVLARPPLRAKRSAAASGEILDELREERL